MNSRLVQLIVAVLLSAASVAVGYFTGQKDEPDAAEITCEVAQALLASEACASAPAPAAQEAPASAAPAAPVEAPVEAASEEVPSAQ